MNLDEMGHKERSDLLGSILGPRPVFLVGTKSPDGVKNLAPMSSINILSNSPPLISMSISTDRGGRVRDTLSNIREAENGCRVSIHCLRGDMIGAADVQAAASPVPRETSEWDLISGSAIHDTSGDLLSSAIATIHTKVVEIRKLPESSKAFLVIMLAESLATIPNSEEPTSRLVQISNRVLSGSSDGSTWKYELDW